MHRVPAAYRSSVRGQTAGRRSLQPGRRPRQRAAAPARTRRGEVQRFRYRWVPMLYEFPTSGLTGVLGDQGDAIPKRGPVSWPLGSRWNRMATVTGNSCGRVPRVEPASPKTPERPQERKPHTARRMCAPEAVPSIPGKGDTATAARSARAEVAAAWQAQAGSRGGGVAPGARPAGTHCRRCPTWRVVRNVPRAPPQ